jgi:hypothetical protein
MFWTSLIRKTTTGATGATHRGPGIAPHGERPRTHAVRPLAEEFIMTKISKLAFAASLLAVSTLLAVSSARAESPGIRHTVFMAGSVIEASDEGIYLCIGTAEGAAPGQVLDVVRVTRVRSGNPKQGIRFHREKVGKVKVEAIVDEHFAQATVLDGKVEKGDIVRLVDPEDSMKN